MARWLLVLMLVVMQLLSSSWGVSYVCIKNDGTYCCIDRGPASCRCCHHDEDQTAGETYDESADDCHSHCQHLCGDHHHDDEALPSDEPRNIVVQSSGCTHIQISMEQPASITRLTFVVDVQRIVANAALPSDLTLMSVPVSEQFVKVRLDRPPSATEFVRSFVSTVVIRC